MIKLRATPFDLPDGRGESDPPPPPEEISFSMDEFEVEYSAEEGMHMDIRSECEDFFRSGGILANAAAVNGIPCEERPQQMAMAMEIAAALANGKNLCVEAPTGVGKSFAYLVPLIYRSQYARRPALISTETIHLQQQLMEKDLPFLREVTGIPFRAALAKGRQNYLCRRRLALLTGEQRDALLPVPSLVLDTERLIRNLENGMEGERYAAGDRVDPTLWSLVCSESGNCAGPKCDFYRSCYYFRARRQWDEADIVIANHALFLTDLAIRRQGGTGALLPDYDAILMDEAHTLENNAAEYLGLHLSQPAVVSMLNRLYNPERAKGLLMRPGSEMLPLRALAAAARDEAYGFFAPYRELLQKNEEKTLRLPSAPDEYPDRLTPALLALGKKLDEVIEGEENDAFRTELEAARERCAACVNMIGEFIQRQIKDAVYYIEEERGSVTLHAPLLNVADLLRDTLFNGDMPVMLCSATLTVRNSFDHFVRRCGFTGGPTVRLDSPFSPRQAKVIVPRNLPDPVDTDYLPRLAAEIRKQVERTDGKAFVLFTSYQALHYCADALREDFAARGWRILEQGGEMNRNRMLQEFREDLHSVLFGADSFWTGVDVPGETLSSVIVTRLPFASPGHPLIAARLEKIRLSGQSDFAQYSLPEAILKFRQGAGRLIRSKTDRGYIIILDPRVISKAYGRGFLESIPYPLENP